MSRRGENIRKRRDGRWEARLLLNKDDNGKYHYKYIYGNSYKEVKEKRNEAYIDFKNNVVAEKEQKLAQANKENVLFSQLMIDWLVFIKSQVKESTYARYRFDVEKHIIPCLGKYLVNNVNTVLINEFATKKLNEGRIDGKGGLSSKTVNCLLSIIKQVLSYGYESNYVSQYIKINCVRYATPKNTVITNHDLNIIEKYCIDNPSNISLGILISMFTGLRIGEVCALKWGDISLDSGLIYVCKTAIRIQDYSDSGYRTKLIIDNPKTECSNREIPIPSFLISILESKKNDDKYFILTGSENIMEPRLYYKKFKEILKELNMDKYNYHALRHTFATRCVELNFDIKSLSEILGHSNINVTLTRYVHPSMELKKKQMEKLNPNNYVVK